jgi:hypothetical protein
VGETILIPRRFNGPPDSGHGGYSCGVVAALLGGVVGVTLRSPPPLERSLAVERNDGGLTVSDGDALVSEARPAGLSLDVPDPVSMEQAAEGNRRGHAGWAGVHPFPTCLVCGPERDGSDGFGVIAGPIEGEEVHAADWTPAGWLAGDGGAVRPEFVWAALDCPSSTPAANDGGAPPIVLARLTASLEAPVRAGEPHALVAWPLELDGRKRHTGVALFDSGGSLLARARALWIELKPGA